MELWEEEREQERKREKKKERERDVIIISLLLTIPCQLKLTSGHPRWLSSRKSSMLAGEASSSHEPDVGLPTRGGAGSTAAPHSHT